jgi:glycosyltransferase involved in cell wall biosynthesis
MVLVDVGDNDQMRKAIQSKCKLVGTVDTISEADIVVTDNPVTVEKAGRLGVAIVAYASPDITEMVNHEKDSFIYLNEEWMIHWLNKLADDDFREKVAEARKKHQKELDAGVTVVIPCYKQSHLLERSVGSVMKQTDQDFRIIIVDDGSPDDVPGVFSKLKEKWPKASMKLIRQSNRGLSGARNAGFAAAQTGWVVPLDADDELLPEYISCVKEARWKHRADVVFTDIVTDNHGFATMTFQPRLLTQRNTIVCTCLIRKELWQSVGGYDEDMRLGYEDWEFWIRCVQANARFAKASGGALFNYHDSGTSMLSTTQRNVDEVMSYVRSKHWKLFAIPRVSVVIPCYKQAHYLERCLESVFNQTEKDIEVIVVDDGSPDNVKAEVNRLHVKFQRNITLITQENQGLPVARNKGFTKAKAEWVIPLDADDRLGQIDYVEKCLAQAKGGIGVVMTDGLSVTGKRTNSVVDLKRLRKENTMHACQMIRRYEWFKLGGYRQDFKEGYEDWEFWVHCLVKGMKFAKAEGIYLLIDDDHEGRMTPHVQKAEAYWRLLGRIRALHPEFFDDDFLKKKTADLTVVLSSYNQRKEIELVLESYKHQTMMPKEVIINDDGSTDGTLEYLDGLTDLPFELRYVTRQHSWYRLASGNNSAAKHAKGSRILFTNGDQLHCPTSFEAHSSLPENRVGGGVFKGIALGHSQKVTKEMISRWDDIRRMQENFPSAKNNLPHIQQTDPNVNPIGVWGGNFSVPATTFQDIGGYNEEYDVGWGGEENDLVKRCVQAGCRVEWVKKSEIFHLDHPIRAYAHSMLGSHKYIKELK